MVRPPKAGAFELPKVGIPPNRVVTVPARAGVPGVGSCPLATGTPFVIFDLMNELSSGSSGWDFGLRVSFLQVAWLSCTV